MLAVAKGNFLRVRAHTLMLALNDSLRHWCQLRETRSVKKFFVRWRRFEGLKIKNFSSMALPAHSGPRPLIQFRNHVWQTVGLLRRVISPSRGCYLNTRQHKHRKKAHTKHPYLEWDSNTRSQRPSEQRQFMALWPAQIKDNESAANGVWFRMSLYVKILVLYLIWRNAVREEEPQTCTAT
jgi:hypothetical protein